MKVGRCEPDQRREQTEPAQRTAEIGVQMARPEWPWAPMKQSALEGKNACCHDIHAQGHDLSGAIKHRHSVSVQAAL